MPVQQKLPVSLKGGALIAPHLTAAALSTLYVPKPMSGSRPPLGSSTSSTSDSGPTTAAEAAPAAWKGAWRLEVAEGRTRWVIQGTRHPFIPKLDKFSRTSRPIAWRSSVPEAVLEQARPKPAISPFRAQVQHVSAHSAEQVQSRYQANKASSKPCTCHFMGAEE